MTGFLELVPHVIMALLFGVAFYHVPDFLVTTSSAMNMDPGLGLLMGLLAFQISAMYFPHMLNK